MKKTKKKLDSEARTFNKVLSQTFCCLLFPFAVVVFVQQTKLFLFISIYLKIDFSIFVCTIGTKNQSSLLMLAKREEQEKKMVMNNFYLISLFQSKAN